MEKSAKIENSSVRGHVEVKQDLEKEAPASKPKNIFQEKYEEMHEEKRKAKEKLETIKLKIISNQLNRNEPLDYKQKFQLTFFLKKYFEQQDLSDYLEMKRKYTITTNLVTVASLLNIVVVGSVWRRFLTLKTWQKVGVGVGVFLTTHYSFTYFVKKEAEKMNDQLIHKYVHIFKSMNFDPNKVH